MNELKAIVPAQHSGGSSVTRHTIYAKDPQSAKKIFQKASANLLNVNKWHQLAGPSSAEFQLVNDMGEEVAAMVQKGHFLRISLPLTPRMTAGSGYDWVKVEKVEGETQPDYEWIAIRVRPRPVPFLLTQDPPHFFSKEASSSFILERKGLKVSGAVYGRNEKPNTTVSGLFNKIRNAVVAIAAILGFNKPQWSSLVKGWLTK